MFFKERSYPIIISYHINAKTRRIFIHWILAIKKQIKLFISSLKI